MNKSAKSKNRLRTRRHQRSRYKISGTKSRPRLAVYRSLKHLYVQLIDDEQGITLAAASDLELKKMPGKKQELAQEIGRLIAKKAAEKKIKKAVFDRGGFKYHGQVKALAEGARAGGLEF